MREQAGLSIQDAAALLRIDRTLVSNIEAARSGVSEERVRHFAQRYECPDPDLVDALAAMASTRNARHWWDEYRGKLPDGYLEVSEYYATRIRTAQTAHLPGLFQTEEHARALFDLAVPALPRLEVELRVAHRLGRQRVLEGDDPVSYVGIIHEAALRMQFGGRRVAHRQLEHLTEAADRDNVTLLVIPFSVGSFHGAGQSILYAEGTVPQLDSVQLDTAHGAQFADAPTPLANYRSLLKLMEGSALPRTKSRDFIHAIASDL
jgi:transcriptional regulator with XRE-family HTH domain